MQEVQIDGGGNGERNSNTAHRWRGRFTGSELFPQETTTVVCAFRMRACVYEVARLAQIGPSYFIEKYKMDQLDAESFLAWIKVCAGKGTPHCSVSRAAFFFPIFSAVLSSSSAPIPRSHFLHSSPIPPSSPPPGFAPIPCFPLFPTVPSCCLTSDSMGVGQCAVEWKIGFQIIIGFRVSGFGFRVSGFGFRVSGFGFRVSGLCSLTSDGCRAVRGGMERAIARPKRRGCSAICRRVERSAIGCVCPQVSSSAWGSIAAYSCRHLAIHMCIGRRGRAARPPIERALCVYSYRHLGTHMRSSTTRCDGEGRRGRAAGKGGAVLAWRSLPCLETCSFPQRVPTLPHHTLLAESRARARNLLYKYFVMPVPSRV